MFRGEDLKLKARENFEKGHNCSESVFKAYLEVSGRNPAIFTSATCFGGGLAGRGDVCGAVSGALMAIGLFFNREKAEDKQLYQDARDKALEFLKRFEQAKASIYCRDHVSYDLTTIEGREQFHHDKEARQKCTSLVETACGILAEAIDSRS